VTALVAWYCYAIVWNPSAQALVAVAGEDALGYEVASWSRQVGAPMFLGAAASLWCALRNISSAEPSSFWSFAYSGDPERLFR